MPLGALSRSFAADFCNDVPHFLLSSGVFGKQAAVNRLQPVDDAVFG